MEIETAESSRQQEEKESLPRRILTQAQRTKSTTRWRESVSPNAGRFSIGPRVLFVMSSNKDEHTEMAIGQLGRKEAKSLSMDSNWIIAKGLWHDAERLSVNEDTKRGFQKFLSTAQYHSIVMLRDWLHSDYEIEPVVREFYDSLYCNEEASLIHEGRNLKESHVKDEAFRQRTLYQKVMVDLFRVEFSPAHWVAERQKVVFRDLLFQHVDKTRRKAWQARTAQRISWKFTSVSWTEGLDKCNEFSSFKNPLPRMDYCPWLKKDSSRSGFPRYLWHIASKKTVSTLPLPQKVEYTCISHTWGRWRQQKWISISGVPWQVPLNARFNVVELPDTFYKLKDRFATEYIWIDLFCIPQQADDPQLASIATEEIARQAAIFQNATACVAWLNYVNHWVAEYCTLGWLSGQYAVLGSQPGICIAPNFLEAAEHGCNLPLQLTRLSAPTFGHSKPRQKLIEWHERIHHWWRGVRKRFPYYHFEPSDWFSGVWTLQEAYLRPNMVLANKDWNVLCDAAGEPISLEELFAFNHVVWSVGLYGTQVIGEFLLRGHGIEDAPMDNLMQIHLNRGFREKCPPGPRQLEATIAKTHLFPGSVGSRVDPLIQANGRVCTAGRRGRAEAIMSSLGITDWFNSKPQVEDNDLVLDMYPLEFLREAASKIGPDFYLASNESPSPWAMFNPFTRLAGTMLPFGRARDSKYRMKSLTERGTLPCGNAGDLHPSVLSWQIQRNGSIQIPLAAILASNREQSMLSRSTAMLGFWGSRHTESQEVVLSDWIATQPKKFDTFAVCLTKGGSHNAGVILQGRRLGKSTRLVKVGFFVLGPDSLAYYAVPISQPVNWIVV